ncbi:MAG: hypothetical protein FJX75_14075 [Armatimonadetes bacterium]|nr:hypothetical protein [Armatimonadota bacterium]
MRASSGAKLGTGPNFRHDVRRKLGPVPNFALILLASSAHAWQLGELRHAADAPGNLVAGWPPEGGARIERADDKTDPRVTSPDFPATPGKYLASAWLRTGMAAQPDPNYSAVAEIVWADAGGQSLGTERFAAANGVTHVWVYRERPVQAPAGTVSGRVAFRFNWSSTGWAELDRVAVTPLGEQPAAGPPVVISLSAAERIFALDQPLAVRAQVRLREGGPETVRLRMAVSDSRGRQLTTGAAECEARSDRDTEVMIKAGPAEAPLREHLVARVDTDPPSGAAQEFGLLVIPRPTDFTLDETSPFAVLEGHPYVQRWLGARWQRPNFNWNEREMELAKRYGINYVGMINEPNQVLVGDLSLEAYGAYVEESVRRFKRLVKYWELGNEPNLYEPGIPEQWAEILRVGYEAAKRADPECKVMWGGITGLDVDPEMVDKLLAAGGGKYTDIIDVHLYVPIPRMDALLAKVRADMAKHGVDKPIVITETTAMLGTQVNERDKAAHVYKRYAVAESHGVLATWWFVLQWVNTGEFRYCSLIDPGTGEPHEGAAAYARLTEALKGAKYARRLDCGEKSYVYQWRKADRSVFVAWAEGEGATGSSALPCGEGPGTVTDVAGHQWPVNVRDSLEANLRDEPLLIDLPTRDGEAKARGLDFVPTEITLARGSTVPLPKAEGTLEADAPAGLAVNGAAVTADSQAALGRHWLVLRERVAGVDRAFLRLKATLTAPLALDLTPLPEAGGHAAVTARVTNLSADTVGGRLLLLSPVSAGPREDRIEAEFTDLAPNATGEATIDLQGATDPLGRYEFRLAGETDRGVREELTRTLVFTPATWAATPPTIDGKLDDWPEALPIVVGADTGERGDPQDGPPSNPDDLSAKAALQWDASNLYLAVRVRDDTHRNTQRDGALWDGDGLQLGFAPEPYVASSAYYEWGIALTEQGLQAWSWRAVPPGPTGAITFPFRIERGTGETVYEAAIPWQMLAPIQPENGTTFGFGLCVNEQDTANRGYYGWHAGIAGEKDRARFGQVTLRK